MTMTKKSAAMPTLETIQVEVFEEDSLDPSLDKPSLPPQVEGLEGQENNKEQQDDTRRSKRIKTRKILADMNEVDDEIILQATKKKRPVGNKKKKKAKVPKISFVVPRQSVPTQAAAPPAAPP